MLYNFCCTIWMLQCQDNYDTVLWVSQRLLWTEVPWFSHGGSCMKQQYWFYTEQCTTPLLFLFHISEVSQCAWIQVSQVFCRAPMEKLKVKQFQICCSNYLSYIKARQAICEQIYFWLVRLRSKLSDICFMFHSETNTVASILIDFTWFTPQKCAWTTQLCGKWLF